MRPKSWNDFLALLVLVTIPVLWGLQAKSDFELAGEVNGALIATWTLVVQYYFRRAPAH